MKPSRAILFIFFGVCLHAQTPVRLSDSQAAKLGEQFILMNGYTDSTVAIDTTALSLEFGEVGSSRKQSLEHRHNTLESKAFGTRQISSPLCGWVVAFRYSSTNPSLDRILRRIGDNAGRAVFVDSAGTNMRLEHKDCTLSTFKALNGIK